MTHERCFFFANAFGQKLLHEMDVQLHKKDIKQKMSATQAHPEAVDPKQSNPSLPEQVHLLASSAHQQVDRYIYPYIRISLGKFNILRKFSSGGISECVASSLAPPVGP